jgi:hypothetical protein
MPAPTMMTFNFNFDEAVVGFALAIVEEVKIVYVEDSVGEEKVGKDMPESVAVICRRRGVGTS